MIHERTAPHAALLLRVSLGVMLLAHGFLKVFVFTPAGTAGFFESLGLPGFLAYPTIIAEVGGGAALILGVYTRPVSLALVPILIGSIIFAHADAGWLFSNEGGGWEFPAFWTIALVVQALLGDGPYALNPKTLLSRTVRPRLGFSSAE
jgi:putative oxidoreductase